MGLLRFVFGPSGSGKSKEIYEELIRRASEEEHRNFLVIVPDQYTMQTQKTLATMSPTGGILNIDVLSFGRLTHRILEEVGTDRIPVLDDTGKSLILQKVASSIQEELPVLGRRLHKQGYIHEAKSALSEFMQYGIRPEGVEELIRIAGDRGALSSKLKDLKTLYTAFQEYLAGNFITTEEKLDVLCDSMERSAIIPGSVVLFDGFTGFTPIQLRAITRLMTLADETILTLVLGADTTIEEAASDQNLFYLSGKTYADVCRLAQDNKISRGEDIYCSFQKPREELAYLDKALFRYDAASYQPVPEQIHLAEMTSPREEVHQVALEICRQIREKDYSYRDIAVICGDLDSYSSYVEREFSSMGIPVFLDRTNGIRLNPLVEAIRSCLLIYMQNFSRESVFHYLRSGLAPLSPEETDLLEDYCATVGIRGFSAWNKPFEKIPKGMAAPEDTLEELNRYRCRFMEPLLLLRGKKRETAGLFIRRLYDFLVFTNTEKRLREYEEMFREEGDLSRAREYAQVYNLVMQLLDQIYMLLGEEKITIAEFAEILDAGFGEIRVGSVPQNVDRVLVGDMERTRVSTVKILFMLGVNDGNIPKAGGSGGILSDLDREFLNEEGIELAPTPRQEMYSQRLYLYLNMTKPTEELFVSYANLDLAGKSLRPSYLIQVMREMFPGLQVDRPETASSAAQIVNLKEGLSYYAEELREYAALDQMDDARLTDIMTLQSVYDHEHRPETAQMEEAAFARWEELKLRADIAEHLYGTELTTSVSQLESYGRCAYQYFLRYGLLLRESRDFEVGELDTGNVYHEVLHAFAQRLLKDKLDWKDFTEEYMNQHLPELLKVTTENYGNQVFLDNARNSYYLKELQRVLSRTIMTLQKHMKNGAFVMTGTEVPFRREIRLTEEAADHEKRALLTGRIDRVDLAEDGEHILVKIVDYKSGSKDLKLGQVYEGLQLQLPLYMNQELEKNMQLSDGSKEIFPAAMLYYHVDDPMIRSEFVPEESGEQTVEYLSFRESLQREIDKSLKMKGLVSDQEFVLGKLDKALAGLAPSAESSVLQVKINKDGSFSKGSQVASDEEFRTVIAYAEKLAAERSGEILDGHISVKPTETGSCEYCPFKNSCRFDAAIPGYQKRVVDKLEEGEALLRMKEYVTGSKMPEATEGC